MPHYEVYGCECCGGYTFPDTPNWGSSIYRWYKTQAGGSGGDVGTSETFTDDSDHQGDCDHYNADYDTALNECKTSVASQCVDNGTYHGYGATGQAAALAAANAERCLPALAANKFGTGNPSTYHYYTLLTNPGGDCEGTITCHAYMVEAKVAEFVFAGIWTPPFFCIGSYDTTWTYNQHAAAGEGYAHAEVPAPIAYNAGQCEWATLNDNEPPCV